MLSEEDKKRKMKYVRGYVLITVFLILLAIIPLLIIKFTYKETKKTIDKRIFENSIEVELYITDKYTEVKTVSFLFVVNSQQLFYVVAENIDGDRITFTATQELYGEFDVGSYCKVKTFDDKIVAYVDTLEQGWIADER